MEQKNKQKKETKKSLKKTKNIHLISYGKKNQSCPWAKFPKFDFNLLAINHDTLLPYTYIDSKGITTLDFKCESALIQLTKAVL